MPLPQKKAYSDEARSLKDEALELKASRSPRFPKVVPPADVTQPQFSLKEACNGESHTAEISVEHDGPVQRLPVEWNQNSADRQSINSAPMSNQDVRQNMTEPPARLSTWNPQEHKALRDSATVGGATIQGDFKQLLSRLDEQHEVELSSLQVKINRLNYELNRMQAKRDRSGRQDGQVSPRSIRLSAYSLQTEGSAVINEGDSVASDEPGVVRLTEVNANRDNKQPEEPTDCCKERTAFRKSRTFAKTWDIRSQWKEDNRPLGSLYEFDDNEVTTNIPRISATSVKPTDKAHRSIFGRYSIFVIHPASSLATTWNSFTFCVVMYDLMTIPLQVFDPPSHWFWDFTGWATQIYWNFDLCLSFFFGFYEKGVVILAFARTAKHYLKTWFALDVTIVSFDWMLFAFGKQETSSAGFSRFGKTLRGLKFLRVIRLLKTAKVMHASENFQDLISSDLMQHFSVVKMLMGVLILNHLTACLWYAVGDTEDGSGWVERDEVADWNFVRRYITSYHWAITQLGVGGSFHTPYNTAELFSTSAILMIGIVVFSSVISSVTNSVAAMKERKVYQLNQFRLFRRFCRDYQIPVYLVRRVRTFLLYKMDYDQRRVQKDQITMFNRLSESLLSEIHESMFSPALETSGFVKTLKACGVPGMVRRIATRAILEAHVGNQDILFSRGEVAVRAFVTCSGILEYDWPYSDRVVMSDRYAWVGQPCLWLHGWLHAGKLKAQEESEILCLELEPFSEAINTHGQAWEVAHMFATLFAERLAEAEDCSDLFDVEIIDNEMSSTGVNFPVKETKSGKSKCWCWS